ncbi:arginine--tRNA ligase [Lentzea rhizosphaerae]|uniref:Arginine--tRNA ligase n=1 Tax=Lentzea rhizosphaerae TaxID=2041025 RepID=A0ABV8C7W6_9PSEU
MEITAQLARAVRSAVGVELDPDVALLQSSRRPGVDFQSDIALQLAQVTGVPPREVAAAIANAVDREVVELPEVSGPGFLNVVVRRSWLSAAVARAAGDARLGVPVTSSPRRIALDYSSPNAAKEMHVGHLRSTIIGDALVRLLRFAGHDVVPHNHVGDWGTPFGMLVEHLVDVGWDGTAGIADLNTCYQDARRKFDSDPAFADRARSRVVALQRGDDRTRELWRLLIAESARHLDEIYALLGVSLTSADTYGESFYQPMLDETLEDLRHKGLTELSDGAVCLFPPGFRGRDGSPLPLIVRKSDGAYGYHATDLATIRYWTGPRGATDLLFVVGAPQSLHFRQLFAAGRQAGYLTGEVHAEHIGFGTVLDEDGRPVRSRAGESVKLADLLAAAVDRADEVLAARSSLGTAERAEVARAVGIGAVKYAELSVDRLRDYVFTWDRMLAPGRNTAMYVQYAHARAASILRAAGGSVVGRPDLRTPAEHALALHLVRFPDAVDATLRTHAPHKLCAYLHETAAAFNGFYDTCPVLAAGAPPEVRSSRLVLTGLAASVLALGLSLLGIEAPERM